MVWVVFTIKQLRNHICLYGFGDFDYKKQRKPHIFVGFAGFFVEKITETLQKYVVSHVFDPSAVLPGPEVANRRDTIGKAAEGSKT